MMNCNDIGICVLGGIVAAVYLWVFSYFAFHEIRRRRGSSKAKPKRNLLREMRLEAFGKLDFVGGWCGFWTTSIMGVRYRSEIVSGFKYCVGDYGTFLQDAIIDRCHLLRDEQRNSDAIKLCNYGRERHIGDKGKADWW